MWACGAGIVRAEGVGGFYKGLLPALAGIAPYAAINFATYDGLKAWAYGTGCAPGPLRCARGGGARALGAQRCRDVQGCPTPCHSGAAVCLVSADMTRAPRQAGRDARRSIWL